MSESEIETIETEIVDELAVNEIAEAVSGRRAIARKHILRLRKRNPEASPAELIRLLERQYVTAITTAGAIVSAGAIAVDVGIALIPGVGAAAAGVKSAGTQAAKKAGKEAAKVATKAAVKQAAKGIALGAAKNGAQRVAAMLPAGDQQLQFEITAVFALALAEIHSMDLDKEQSQTLVYGLTNDRLTQQQIATMASDVAVVEAGGIVDTSRQISSGRGDWTHWANTLSGSLPAGAAQSLVQTMQTGQLESVRGTLSGKQQATIEYGVGAVVGGVTRFAFGRDVVTSSHSAFAEAPEKFPAHLAVPDKSLPEDIEPNRALLALENAAKSSGSWISGSASAATRVFRSVDLDGDGVPDEAQAFTAVKNAGGAVAGAASRVGGNVAGAAGKVGGLFRKRGVATEPNDTAAIEG